MKRDLFTMQLDLGNELIIDNFAGGGGTSTGLEWAFGRPVDIAINHDPEALAMHAANHPHTKHLCESVWDVDPIKVTNNQPVGLVWLSPDCKHFSKAKGGKPVEKRIRGLAWVTMRWAAKCKPRVIMLENVEEFKTWGPLLVDADGNAKPDPAKKGKTFESFIRQLRGHGYDVEYQELRANDHDTPTIRKRFFLVARRDGLPIRWPVPTHAAPKTIAVQAGKLKPYRTAAECIDWSIPCQSIFNRKKPLAEATLRRIAKGIMRYVVDAAEPFIVGQGGPIYSGKPKSVAEPFGTLTTENHRAVVLPTIVPVTHQGGDRSESINDPFRTITGAQRGEKALATATLAPFVMTNTTGHAGAAADAPVPTVTAAGNQALATATLSAVLVDAAHGEVSPGGVKRWGSGAHKIDAPIGTVLTSGNKALVTAFLSEHANASNQRVMPVDEPLRTICAQVKGGHFSMVSAHITKFRTGATGSDLNDPLPTITAGPKENPAGAAHALGIVASNLVKLRGTSTASGTDEPLGTVSAGGQHHAEVRAFLLKYYGSDQDPRLEDPMHTVTSKDRFGLVTIHGQDYQIVDIGLRMLAPRELFRAQGFPDSYIIDSVPDWERLFVDGEQVADVKSIPWRPLTKSSQVRMCGNSVCPPMARALIEANFGHEREIARAA
ncbi:MAG: DNA cytosine methyltransferase [Burkholderiaceae bacterium]|nr:DNA cytosine methyltransferase [Burkholderiaceae bacterium]